MSDNTIEELIKLIRRNDEILHLYYAQYREYLEPGEVEQIIKTRHDNAKWLKGEEE